MNPFVSLIADHRTMERLFNRLAEAKPGQREALVQDTVQMLTAHMDLEERIVYPLLQRLLDPEVTEEAESEHTLAREGIVTLLELTPDDPGFDGALEMLKAGVLHHAKEEEQDLLPELTRKLGDEGAAVAHEIAQVREELGMRVIDLRDATREELELIAQVQDLPGRSTMNADQLRRALAKTTG